MNSHPPQYNGRYPIHPQQNFHQGYPPQQVASIPQYPPQHYPVHPQGQPIVLPQTINQQRTYVQVNSYPVPGNQGFLKQPPALKPESEASANSQFIAQRGPMKVSNNHHSEFDTYTHQEDPMLTNEANIASMFWEQRCMTMLERFEWFYQRFQILRNEHVSLSEQMQKMDSEEQWHIFQQHHQEFHQKIEEMEQQLTAVLGENEQLLQQRQVQDSENIWQQRYQQLLGNFKSLQEEMAQNGGQGGIPPEEYTKLEQHCAQLEYQNEQLYNELNSNHERSKTSELQSQVSTYLEEIESYKNSINSLHSQNIELRKYLQQCEAENEHLKKEGNKFVTDRKRLDDLIKQMEQKQSEIQSLQQQFKNRSVPQVNSLQYQQVIEEKNKEIEQLKRLQMTAKQNGKDSTEVQRKKRESQSAQYQKQISTLKQQVKKLTDSSLKMENLQRKMTYSNQQITNLNDILKKKNQQLIQLRSLSYEVQKLKETQSLLLNAAEERDHFANILHKKGQEIENMHVQIQRLNEIIAEMNVKRHQYSARNLRQEIQDLTEQLRKYQSEINKLKNIVTLKEEYSSKFEEQLRRTSQKLISTEQILQAQRQNWHEKQIKLSSKNNDYNQKLRVLDYDFNLQLKDTLQRQIVSLRRQNAQRQQTIRSLQQKQYALQSELSVFQRQQDNYNRDLSLQKQKEKQLIAQINAQAKRFKQAQQTLKNKNEELLLNNKKMNDTLVELSILNQQMEQHERLLKVNNITIKQLQQQINISLIRQSQTDKLIVQNTNLKKNIQALERQRIKIDSPLAKSKGLSINESKNQLLVQSRQNVIEELWKQNQYLKLEISNLINKHANDHTSLNKDDTSLNKRLNEFNQRLNITIKSSNNAHLSREQSEKTLILWQRQRNELINHYENQMHLLKAQLQSCKNAGSQISINGFANSKKIFNGGSQLEIYRQQISFLKKKSLQQENINNNLIKVNEQLREKIDSMLKVKQNHSTLEYYKSQLQRAGAQKESLKEKLKKLGEQNRENKLQLAAKNTKLTQNHQFKVMQLELQLQEQQRKISLLLSEKTITNNQNASQSHAQNLRNLLNKTLQQKTLQQKNDVITPKSNHSYKLGMHEQFSNVIGNNVGYSKAANFSKGVNISTSGVRGNKYQL